MIETSRLKNPVFLPIIVFIFILCGIWLRFQPSAILLEGFFPKVLFTDPWYTLRQIELMVMHFPSQIWFDPMTNFPQGKPIDWGPLLPWIGSTFCLITGMTTPASMIPLVSWIPVLCFVLVIPTGYYLGKTISDQKTGVITALILSVLPGNFLIRTLYGNVDHHCLEILIGAAFSLCYIIALSAAYQRNRNKTIIYGIIGGFLLVAGILNSPTILIFVLICLIFSFIHSIISFLTRTNESGIFYVNALIFGIGFLGPSILVLMGFPEGVGNIVRPWELVQFLMVVPIVSAGLWILGILSRKIIKTQKNCSYFYLTFLAGIIISFVIVFPALYQRVTGLLAGFFFFPNEYIPVGEMQAWNLETAFQTYNLLLILFIIGIIFTIYRWLKTRDVSAGYLSVWALVCLGATITHVRYEYYLAIPLVLTSSLVIAKIFDLSPLRGESVDEEGEIQPPADSINPGKVIGFFTLCAVLLMFGIFSYMIATTDYSPYTVSDDMIEGMTWLTTHSPDPGVDYYKNYQQESQFSYPPESYGLLSWWESGHVINFISHRPVIADPFQSHANTAAGFFLSPNETAADLHADETKARYIITDSSMLFDNLAVMLQTYNPYQTVNDYYGYVTVSDPVNNTSHNDIGFKEPFYQSMITRLHVFDGSATAGETPPFSPDAGNPVPGTDMIVYFPGSGSDPTVSSEINVPLQSIEALRHYRLIWESNISVSATEKHDIRKVKIFERVNGARILGDGTIELPVITNQGREFTYRQQSINGSFIAPYSTEIRDGYVHATGPYKIVESGKEIQVSEKDI